MTGQDRREVRRKLAALAGTQSGYFTAAQALGVGYSYPVQRYHAIHNNWMRVDRGLYRLPEWPVGPHEDLVRWTLWSRGNGIVSHHTALAVHDLGDVNPAQVHLTVPPGFRAHAPGVVLHHGTVAPADTDEQAGFRVTNPLRSLLDVAAGPLDLDQLAGAVSEAIRRGLLTEAQLRGRADAFGPYCALRVERALAALRS